MRVFLTGATGYIGRALATSLRERGHDVGALVRPESDSHRLRDAGVVILAGDMASLPTLSDALSGYDVFVHAAQSNSPADAELIPQSLATFAAQKGFLIYTSGVWVLGNTTGVADESPPGNPLPIAAGRPAGDVRGAEGLPGPHERRLRPRQHDEAGERVDAGEPAADPGVAPRGRAADV